MSLTYLLTYTLIHLLTSPDPNGAVFHVNLAQIRSAVPEIFHTQTKNQRLTAPKTEPYTVHCVWQKMYLSKQK